MTATPPSASGRPSPGSAAPPACSSAGCSRRGPAGAGCCSSTSRSARSPSSAPSSCSSASGCAPARLANFDALGALLVTGGMLLLVYTLVKAPDVGWGAARTIAGLAGSAVLLAAFVVNELRVRNPLVPLSILRVKGVAAADATQLVAAGRLPADVLLPHALHADRARLLADPDRRRLPAADGRLHHRRQHLARSCSRASAPSRSSSLGAVIAAGGLYWLSRIPVDGSYVVGHPARPAGRLDRHGRRLHRPDHGRQRGRRRGQGRARRRAPQHRPATRRRARPRDPLRSRHRTDEVGAAAPATASPRPRPTGTSAHSWSARSSCSRRPSSRS